MLAWFSKIPIPIQAALIGALMSIVTILLKDFLGSWWSTRREDAKTSLDIYRGYAEPLGSSVISLFWRLNEIFLEENRSSFLMAGSTRTPFEEYKLYSTYYRIAAVLGWIRALRRELSFLRIHSTSRMALIEDAFDAFESALADGNQVEMQRLEGLIELWQIPSDMKCLNPKILAAEVDQQIQCLLRKARQNLAETLTEDEKRLFCSQLSKNICLSVGIKEIPDTIINETVDQAIGLIDIKQAWLFRDWQAAIGDLMVQEIDSDSRRFEVRGYYFFESMLIQPTIEQKRWIERIEELFHGCDVLRRDKFDSRPAMLRNLFLSTAGLVCALRDANPNLEIVNSITYRKAKTVICTNKH